MTTPPRVFAIDWSGDKRNARRKIWLAETGVGQLVRLECGRTREEICELLIDEARKDHRFIVGLDFSFSFPTSFCGSFNAKNVYEVWNQVALRPLLDRFLDFLNPHLILTLQPPEHGLRCAKTFSQLPSTMQ